MGLSNVDSMSDFASACAQVENDARYQRYAQQEHCEVEPQVTRLHRGYMINGLIGFCEQQTKFVSGSKLPRPSHPVSVVNFANALIRPGDSLCFHNTVDRVDPTIRIAPMHFYHRVYQNMVRNERHPIVGDGSYVDLRFRETADYFVLVFQCTRIWVPASRTATTAGRNRDNLFRRNAPASRSAGGLLRASGFAKSELALAWLGR